MFVGLKSVILLDFPDEANPFREERVKAKHAIVVVGILAFITSGVIFGLVCERKIVRFPMLQVFPSEEEVPRAKPHKTKRISPAKLR
jgi:hypothetical protein